MLIVHSYLAAVAIGILAAFTWIVRGIRADEARLEGDRPRPAASGGLRRLDGAAKAA